MTTNFDKIRNMTLDEMAEFLLDVYYQAENIVNFGRTEYIKTMATSGKRGVGCIYYLH